MMTTQEIMQGERDGRYSRYTANEILRLHVDRSNLLKACQKAYRKHVSMDDSIGWDELGNILCDALCNAMGSDEFVRWNESYNQSLQIDREATEQPHGN